MATWTDGAAYAPIERPDGFATPETDPLPLATPFRSGTAGAMPPPRGFAQNAPTIPLDRLQVEPPPSRNPGQPFDVSRASLTGGSSLRAVGEPRDPREAFQVRSASATAVAELPPPTGKPLPPPSGAMLAPTSAPRSSLPVPEGAMLPPGTLPPPVGAPVRAASPDSTQRTLVGLGLACCLMGTMVPPAAPWLILVTGLLMLRTPAITGGLSALAVGVGLALGLMSATGTMDLNPVNLVMALCFSLALLFRLVQPAGPPRS